jgi:uncharacterized membrane protein
MQAKCFRQKKGWLFLADIRQRIHRLCLVLDRLADRDILVLAVTGAAAIWLMSCQWLRFYAFELPAYDLRIHEELVANTLRGRLLYSDLLGECFLSHHVSPIFILFAPLYALWPSPVWLLILQGILVGCAGWFLWLMARSRELRPILCLAVVCAFFMFNGMQTGYFRGFQPEILGMCFAMGFLWAVQGSRWMAASAWGLLTISCREDFALFLLPIAGLLIFQKGKRVFGIAAAMTCLSWLVLSYGFLIPMYAPTGQMAGMERWSQYGNNPMEIAAYWVKHPQSVFSAIANQGASRQLKDLFFLPLADPATLLTIGAPWIIYTTSSFGQQAALGGAYAAMFVAFLFAGMVHTLARRHVRALAGHDVLALLFVALLLVTNARLCPLPKSFSGLSAAHSALTRVNADISSKRVLAQGCIIPHLGRSLSCDMLGSPRATGASGYDLVLVSLDKDPWPLDAKALTRLVARLDKSGAWQHDIDGCLHVFRRIANGPLKPAEPRR